MNPKASGTPSPGAGADLEQRLTLEFDQLEELHALLSAELRALLDRDAPRILAAAAEKRSAMETLVRTSEQSRAAWLAHHRASGRPDSRARQLLEQVRSSWQKAEASNSRNAAVMKIHQSSVLRGLGVLRQTIGGTDVYRADGRTSGHYLSA